VQKNVHSTFEMQDSRVKLPKPLQFRIGDDETAINVATVRHVTRHDGFAVAVHVLDLIATWSTKERTSRLVNEAPDVRRAFVFRCPEMRAGGWRPVVTATFQDGSLFLFVDDYNSVRPGSVWTVMGSVTATIVRPDPTTTALRFGIVDVK
jgi:hypothetical protein